MKRKKIWLLTTLLCLCLLSFLLIPGCNKGETSKIEKKSDTIVKIGAIIAKTGFGALYGEQEHVALRILEEELEKRGTGFKLKVIVEDNKSSTKDGVNAANKLLEVEGVDFLFTDLTNVAMAILPQVNKSKKILIGTVYAQDLLTNSPYAFRNLPDIKQEAEVLAAYLKKNNPNIKTFGVITTNDEFGKTSLRDFEKVSAANGYSIIIAETMDIIQSDVQNICVKVKNQHPDAVFVSSLAENLGFVIRYLRVLEYKNPIISTDSFAYPFVYEAAGKYSDGIIYADFSYDPEYSDYKNYVAKFKALSHNKEPLPVSFLAYEGVKTIFNIIETSQTTKTEDIITKSEGFFRKGIMGEIGIKGRQFFYKIEAKVFIRRK